jgi:hypothetical protein
MPDTTSQAPTVPGTWVPREGVALAVNVSDAQWHGRACVWCGSALDGLLDAGHVQLGSHGWPVKACPHHTRQEAAA